MRARCENPGSASFQYYGARGVKVCERWQTFESFLRDMGEAPANHSIERLDCAGDYDPGNCVWIPKTEQAENRRNSTKLTIDGVTKTIGRWAHEHGIADATLRNRLERGVPPKIALGRLTAWEEIELRIQATDLVNRATGFL